MLPRFGGQSEISDKQPYRPRKGEAISSSLLVPDLE